MMQRGPHQKRFVVAERSGRVMVDDNDLNTIIVGLEPGIPRKDALYFAQLCADALNADFEACDVIVRRLEIYHGVSFGPRKLR